MDDYKKTLLFLLMAMSFVMSGCGGGGDGGESGSEGSGGDTPTVAELFYSAYAADGDGYHLYASSVDGLDLPLFPDTVDPLMVSTFVISPDGNYVAMRGREFEGGPINLYIDDLRDNAPPMKVSGGDLIGANLGFKWSPNSTRIAYTSESNDIGVVGKNLYIVKSDGTGLHKVSELTNIDDEVSVFAWAPNGGKIAYTVKDVATGEFNLYSAVALEGQTGHIIHPALNGGRVHSFKWAPNSSRIAFWATLDSSELIELYSAVPVEGLIINLKINMPIGEGGYVSANYDWAPDSSKIAFMAKQDGDADNALYTTSPVGADRIKIDNNVSSFKWSPDSLKLAYLANVLDSQGPNNRLLFVYEGGSFLIHPIPAAGGGVNSIYHNSHNSYYWSPDSNMIAFSARLSSSEVSQDVPSLYVTIAPFGGFIHTKIFNAGVKNISWAPDSSRLAFMSSNLLQTGFELFTASPDGSDIRAMNDEIVNEFRNVSSFKWSPDSEYLAFRASLFTDDLNTDELYSVTATGMDNIKVSVPLTLGNDVGPDFSWVP